MFFVWKTLQNVLRMNLVYCLIGFIRFLLLPASKRCIWFQFQGRIPVLNVLRYHMHSCHIYLPAMMICHLTMFQLQKTAIMTGPNMRRHKKRSELSLVTLSQHTLCLMYLWRHTSEFLQSVGSWLLDSFAPLSLVSNKYATKWVVNWIK